MPRVDQLPRDNRRLFGRVERFTVECPHCGNLIRAAFQNISHTRRMEAGRRRRATGRSTKRPMIFNPITQRLQCPSCRYTYAVGLVVYPTSRGIAPEQPYDTVPTWDQLAELRQLSYAIHLKKPIRGHESVNILVRDGCTCEGGQGRRIDPVCAVHGWEEQLDNNGRTLAEQVAALRVENEQLKAAKGK